MRIEIPDCCDDDSLAWFASLSPEIRAVYIQAVWEGEDLPAPLPRKGCDYRKPDCSNEGRELHGRWVCFNHYPA
jgi:hypothetical protein